MLTVQINRFMSYQLTMKVCGNNFLIVLNIYGGTIKLRI